jgi:hypothetical protein
MVNWQAESATCCRTSTAPALPLVFAGVDSMLLSTAWENALPHLTAVGFHSALAKAWNVNVIVANRNFARKNQ